MNISEILQFDNLDTRNVHSPSFDEGLYNTWENITTDYHYDQVKPIPFELKTKVYEAGAMLNIFAFEPRKEYPSIYLGLREYYDGYKVDNVRVEPSIRGQHYGMKLYLAVTKYYRKPLYSGSQQTSASNNGIWKKLIQQYPDHVVGFDQQTKQDLKLKATANGPVATDNQPIYKNIPDAKFDKNKYSNQAFKTRLLKLLP